MYSGLTPYQSDNTILINKFKNNSYKFALAKIRPTVTFVPMVVEVCRRRLRHFVNQSAHRGLFDLSKILPLDFHYPIVDDRDV